MSLRQVTPPAEEAAAAQPDRKRTSSPVSTTWFGLGVVGGLGGAEAADEFDYDELEADLFGGSDDAVTQYGGTRPTTVDSRDPDNDAAEHLRPRSYSKPGTPARTGTPTRTTTRGRRRASPQSKPGTRTARRLLRSRPQTEGPTRFDDDSDFEIGRYNQ